MDARIKRSFVAKNEKSTEVSVLQEERAEQACSGSKIDKKIEQWRTP